jgi:Fe-S oxidoreductase/nitrate reductase gamma subunit
MANASRELFWNIPLGAWFVYILAIATTFVFIFALYKRYRLLAIGKPDVKLGSWWYRIGNFIVVGIVDGFLHKRIFRETYPGLIHFFLFWGTLVFMAAAALDFLSHYFFHFLYGWVYLGVGLWVDGVGALAIIGVAMAAYRRYVQKPKRLDNKPQDAIALIAIAVIVLTGYLVEGLRLADHEPGAQPEWALFSPVGWIIMQGIQAIGLTDSFILPAHWFMYWFHILLAITAVIYVCLSYTRFAHIILSPVNVFLRPFKPRGQLDTFDIEKAIEKGEALGANQVHHFTWKHLLDADGCTRCGRCQDQCPAFFTDKPLNPKKIVQDLKTELVTNGPAVRAEMDKRAKAPKPAAPAEGTEASPVEPIMAPTIIGSRITEDEIWSCTTCAACVEACPVFIDPIGKIIEMRRNLVLEQTKMPETAQTILKCVEDRGHTCRGTLFTRTDWTGGLGIPQLSEDKNVDYVYWVGCTAALEDRNIKVAKAFASVMKSAGVKIGILGSEESCCGDPVRRMGNEYLYQMLAMKNIEALKQYDTKKIVATCPHCFNTLKNEYTQFGGQFEVISHTELVSELVGQGRLKLSGALDKRLTYHDSCYLGRHNGIYLPPRDVLKNIPSLDLREMKRKQQRAFCCGAGGGRFWMEERIGKRISEERTEEALATGADMVATACPYCLQMFEDAIKAKGKEETFKARDIVELVAESMEKR